MEDENHEEAVDEAEDTDELLCTDLDVETVSEFGFGPPGVSRDHCDLLLDAIDAHLSRLQTHSHSQTNGGKNKTEDVLSSASLDRSNSVSKDTGVGSTVLSTEKATPTSDGSTSEHLDHLDPLTVVSKCRVQLTGQEVEDTSTSRPTGGAKSEECLWRLERLLGTKVRLKEAEEEESVCTEDFSRRFQEEMVEPRVYEADADSVPDVVSISSDTGLLTEPQIIQNTIQTPHIRHLAGVPVRSFDSVTIDSDLDSVCTEQIRQHLHNNRTAQHMFIQNGSHVRRLQNTKASITQTLSSDDEDTLGEDTGQCGRCYRVLKSPVRVQRREKRHQIRKNNTISSASSPAAAVRVVERLREEVEEAERERHALQLSVTQTRAHAQLLRSELRRLQAQRDVCVKEVQALQENQAAIQINTTTCYHDNSPHRCCVSVLEREEMDRLLESAKSELFSEQRRFRNKLDTMQERLEEVTQELEQKDEENRSLREKCKKLEEKVTTANKHREELQESVQSEQLEQESRLGALEKILAQKELLVLGLQEEKSGLQMELRVSREEHRDHLTAALTQAQKEKEEEVEKLKTQINQTHQHEIQKIKQEEVKKQKEVLRRREEELRTEAQEQVKRAVEREQRKWAESLREQKRKMEEVEKRGKVEVERERRSVLTLNNKVVELQKRVEELESEASVQRIKLKTQKEEHQAELQRQQRQIQQVAESEAVHLKQCLKHSEQQLEKLKAELVESERVQQVAAERHDHLNTVWTQEIQEECVCLQEILTQNNLSVDIKHLSKSATVSEAVQMLQSLRKPLQYLISSLQNRISSLTHTIQQLSTDKEVELRLQRDQLTAEKERVLNSLKDKLIQEHMEELSSVSRLRLSEDDDGVTAGLRRQLKAKDEELRLVQRNMLQWKQKTTNQLTQKIEDELSTELERRVSKPRSEAQQRLEMLEAEMRHLPRSYRDPPDVPLSSSSGVNVNVSDLSSSPAGADLASHKLLRHLQTRIRQLQADRLSLTPSQECLNLGRETGELRGSYLETLHHPQIAPVQEGHLRRSGTRTAPS